MKPRERAAKFAADMEIELRAMRSWAMEPIDSRRLEEMGPFGMDKLHPAEWIQFVLLPRLRDIAECRGEFPTQSQIGAWAVKNFDPDQGGAWKLLDLINALDRHIEEPPASDLFEAIGDGDAAMVENLLARKISANAASANGMRALHFAAAAGNPGLDALATNSLQEALKSVDRQEERAEQRSKIAQQLLDAGADVNARSEGLGLTPAMVALFFNQAPLAMLFIEKGAQTGVRDALGRTLERFGVFPTVARALAICSQLPMVRAAWFIQLHAPVSHQFTSPLLGLELTSPLPPDAFSSFGTGTALMITAVGGDAVSNLMKLSAPIYRAPG